MALLETRVLRDAHEVWLQVWGVLPASDTQGIHEIILDPKDLAGQPLALSLRRVTRAVEKDLTVRLYWDSEDEHTLILSLEGTGDLSYEWCNGLVDPRNDGWTGKVAVVVEAASGLPQDARKHFSFVLEFAKLRA